MVQVEQTFVERRLNSARTFLARWKGSRAEMRELTVSIKSLRLLLTFDDRPREQNLVISCIDPHTIRGPVRWNPSDITIEATQDAEGQDAYVVKDVAADVEIVCGMIEVAENVKRF